MKNALMQILAVIAATHPELLEQALAESVAAVGYREDGWSEDTLFGCRRHSQIDAALEELRNGDKYDRRVAAEAAQWFSFHPDRWPSLLPESEEDRGLVRGAYNRAWGGSLIFQGRDGLYPLDFRIPLDEPIPEANRYFDAPDSHAVVFDPSGERDAPAEFPAEYIAGLRDKAQRLRAEGESDDTQPVVSPGN